MEELKEIEEFEELENKKEIKIILIGEAGVGKTCIIYRYINGTFNEDTLNTISISSAKKTITLNHNNNNTKIEFDIWDTCGQEKYRNLVNIFFKDVKAAILVYDSTSRKSFNQMKDYWFDKVKECAPEDVGKYTININMNIFLNSYLYCFK